MLPASVFAFAAADEEEGGVLFLGRKVIDNACYEYLLVAKVLPLAGSGCCTMLYTPSPLFHVVCRCDCVAVSHSCEGVTFIDPSLAIVIDCIPPTFDAAPVEPFVGGPAGDSLFHHTVAMRLNFASKLLFGRLVSMRAL